MRCPIHADSSMEITFNYNIGNSKRYPHIYILMMAYPHLISIIFLSKVMRIISNLIFLVVIMPESVGLNGFLLFQRRHSFHFLSISRSAIAFFLTASQNNSFVLSFIRSFVRLLMRLDGWFIRYLLFWSARDHFEQWWRKEFFHLI